MVVADLDAFLEALRAGKLLSEAACVFVCEKVGRRRRRRPTASVAALSMTFAGV